MQKRRHRTIVPSCTNCDHQFKSVVKDPCLTCGDDFGNWTNERRAEKARQKRALKEKNEAVNL